METDSIEILPFSERHVEAVAAIEGLCFSRPWSAQMLRSELDNPLAVFRVAELGGKPVGYIGMFHVLDEGQIANLAVHPAHRGRGIASALIRCIEDYSKGAGIKRLTLEVRASNHAALSLYRKHGFAENGIRRNYYADPQEDAVLMSREI